MSYEDMLRAVAELPGTDGVEVVSHTTPPTSYPTWNQKELSEWQELLDKYKLKPVCFDSCAHAFVGDSAAREAFLKQEIDYAAATGFPMVRNEIYELDVVERCLGYARDKNVILNLEISHKMQIRGEQVGAYVDLIERTGTKNLGLMPDMSIFQKSIPARLLENARQAGADEKKLEMLNAAFSAGEDMQSAMDALTEQERETGFAEITRYLGHTGVSQLADLRSIVPYMTHFHAKFTYVEEDFTDLGFQYEEVLRLLREVGYEGYICSEYEGARMWPEDRRPNPVEQVQRQRRMFSNILGE